MFPTDPQLIKTTHPIERREAARRAGHVRAIRVARAKAKKGSRSRRFHRARRILSGGGHSRGGLPGSPPGAGGRLLHL